MEDVMDGVENIVGVQKAVNWISTGFGKLDQVLKKLIVHSDSQVSFLTLSYQLFNPNVSCHMSLPNLT